MPVCTITGTLRNSQGIALTSTKVVFQRSGVAGQDGSVVIPRSVEVTSDEAGAISVNLYPGVYTAITLGIRAHEKFAVGVPEELTADLADIIDQFPAITPSLVTQAIAARDQAEGFAEAAETSASRVDLGALDAAVEATGLDAVATGEDRIATDEDRTQTGLDRVATAADAAASGTARTAAETARDAAFVNADVYADTAAGLAGTTVGDQFQVVSGDEVIRYLHETGPVATDVARYPAASVLGGARFGVYETLDTTYVKIITDETGAPMGFVGEDTTEELDAVGAQLAASAGSAASLSNRLNRGITPYGDVLQPIYGAWLLRQSRQRLRQLNTGQVAQFVVNIFGDSWVEGHYFTNTFAEVLQDEYGIAGVGWVGFQYWGTATGAWVDGGSQPPGGCQGNARPDLVARPVLSGTWTSDNGAGGVANPSIGSITTSEVGAYVRYSFPAGHAAAELHYSGDGTGVVRYSWDGGSTWETNLTLSTVGPASIALVNVPAGAGSLRIECVSGNVTLAGTYMTSTANGVRVNGLGASGSNTSQWAGVDLTTWGTRIASLGGHLTVGLLGTNDQATPLEAVDFAANVSALLTAIRAADPATDLLWFQPPENPAGRALAMADYAAAARSLAVDQAWTFVDMQYSFGAAPSEYEDGSTRPLFRADAGHPTATAGRAVVTEALLAAVAPNL